MPPQLGQDSIAKLQPTGMPVNSRDVNLATAAPRCAFTGIISRKLPRIAWAHTRESARLELARLESARLDSVRMKVECVEIAPGGSPGVE